MLAGEGIAASALHLPTLKPIDADAIVALAERTGASSPPRITRSSVGSAAPAEVLGERHPTPMRRIGLRDVGGESAPNDYLLEAYGISAGTWRPPRARSLASGEARPTPQSPA